MPSPADRFLNIYLNQENVGKFNQKTNIRLTKISSLFSKKIFLKLTPYFETRTIFSLTIRKFSQR